MAISRRKGSVPERILASEMFLSGEYFSSSEMARTIGVTVNAVTAACATLRALGFLSTIDKMHRRIIATNIATKPIRKTRFDWEKPFFGPREWNR